MARTTSRRGKVRLGLSVLITLFAAAFAMALASNLQASYSMGNSAHLVYDNTPDWHNWNFSTVANPNVSTPALAGESIAVTFSSASNPQASYSLGNPAYVVYDNTLAWNNWSWRTVVNPNVPSPALTGKSMAVTYSSAWAGLSLHNPGFDTSAYSHLQFAISPGGAGFPTIDVSLYNAADELIKQVNLKPYASAGEAGWYRVSIPLADLGGADRTITRVQLQDGLGGPQATFHLDDLQFISQQAAPPNPPSQQPAPSNPTFGNYRPQYASWEVDQAIRQAAARYNLPRWFYYAIVHRESSFESDAVGPHGEKGLAQIGGSYYAGMPYPMNLNTPNDNDMGYYYAMNFGKFGRWIKMSQVSRATNLYDPGQNLDRFSTGFAVPAFYLFRKVYGLNDVEALRAVAYHWNKGVYKVYDPNNWDYLNLYDKYVALYRPVVEGQDGKWDGKPRLP